MKMNTQQPKLMGHSKDAPERELHSNTGLTKKEKFQISNLTLHLQEVEEQQQNPELSLIHISEPTRPKR